MKTLADLRGKCYDILREEQNSSAYPYTLVDDLINTAQQKICSGLVINPLNQQEVHKTQLPFLNKEAFYQTYGTRYLSKDLIIGDEEIFTDTINYPSEGYLYIAGCIVKYGGKLDDRFTRCENVSLNAKAGTEISFVYETPSDFMSPINLILNDRVQIENKSYDDVFEAMRDNKGNTDYRYLQWKGYDKPFYAIKDDTYLIMYNINTSNDLLRLRYEKIPEQMIDSKDECAIPNDIYAMSVIPYLAVGETMYNRGEEQRGADVINFGMGQLREMYQFYNKTGIERQSGKNYKMAKSKFNI